MKKAQPASNVPFSLSRLGRELSLSIAECALNQLRIACPNDNQFNAARKLLLRETYAKIDEYGAILFQNGYTHHCGACEKGVVRNGEESSECPVCIGTGYVNAPMARVKQTVVDMSRKKGDD